MFERFNGPARRVLQAAFREARRRQHDFLGTEHLLFGLVCEQASPAAATLRALLPAPEMVEGRVEELLQQEETGAALEQLPLTPAVQRTLKYAAEEAARLRRQVVGPEHLLLALLREPDTQAAAVLQHFGLTLVDARTVVAAQPAAEKHDYLLQPTPREAGGGAEPTAAALHALLAPVLPISQSTRASDATNERAPPPDIAGPTLPDAAATVAAMEAQLHRTQLALGAFLGYCFGQAVGGWQLGVLGSLAGACLALLRSSFAGAWMGFMAGCVLLPGFLHDGDERISGKARIVVGLVGALLGSFLGDFWRPGAVPEVPAANEDDDE